MIDTRRIAALAIANQRETFVPVDAEGEPLRPAITWLDERGRDDVVLLSRKLGRDRLREITGKTPDPTPCLYALHWMLRQEPELYRRTARFLDVHGFLVHRLTGLNRTSWASADPTGVYDLAAKAYSAPILEALQLRDPVRHGAAAMLGARRGDGEAAATGSRSARW